MLALVAEGRTNGEAGEILGISPSTVSKHLQAVYTKLNVYSRTAAAALLLTGVIDYEKLSSPRATTTTREAPKPNERRPRRGP